MTELLKCDICLRNLETLKCNDCTFNSCIECITTWYEVKNNKHKCPQCKGVETFDIEIEYNSDDLDEEEEERNINAVYVPNAVIISDFSNLNINVIEQIVTNGRMFPSENFIQNFNNWPVNIKAQWRYNEVKMIIDDIDEIIGYSIHRI